MKNRLTFIILFLLTPFFSFADREYYLVSGCVSYNTSTVTCGMFGMSNNSLIVSLKFRNAGTTFVAGGNEIWVTFEDPTINPSTPVIKLNYSHREFIGIGPAYWEYYTYTIFESYNPSSPCGGMMPPTPLYSLVKNKFYGASEEFICEGSQFIWYTYNICPFCPGTPQLPFELGDEEGNPGNPIVDCCEPFAPGEYYTELTQEFSRECITYKENIEEGPDGYYLSMYIDVNSGFVSGGYPPNPNIYPFNAMGLYHTNSYAWSMNAIYPSLVSLSSGGTHYIVEYYLGTSLNSTNCIDILAAFAYNPLPVLWGFQIPQDYVKKVCFCCEDSHFSLTVNTSSPTDVLANMGTSSSFPFPPTSTSNLWDFDNGTTSDLSYETVTYPSGSYKICLESGLGADIWHCEKCLNVCVEEGSGDGFLSPPIPCDFDFSYMINTWNNDMELNTSLLSGNGYFTIDGNFIFNVNPGFNVGTFDYSSYLNGYHELCLHSVNEDGESCTKCINVCLGLVDDFGRMAIGNGNEDKQNGKNNWLIYPNPASSTINIEYNSDKDGSIDIMLVDVLGKVVTSLSNKSIFKGVNSFSYDLSNVSTGSYVLKIVQDGGYFTVHERINVIR